MDTTRPELKFLPIPPAPTPSAYWVRNNDAKLR
jgi:hypothetical protein